MSESPRILLVDDEPLILMDLEFAAEDCGCVCLIASNVADALAHFSDDKGSVDCAVLDVSLLDGETCLPIAHELDRRGIPYVIHSGDLDRQDETIRSLDAIRIAKPANSNTVVEAALSEIGTKGGNPVPRAVAQ